MRYSIKLKIIVFILSITCALNYLLSQETETKRSLYIFAHQDDELLIALQMAKDVKAKNEVYGIWITDGSVSAPADVREKETRQAMKLIGTPQENLIFLKIKDQESVKIENLKRAVEEVTKFILKIKPNFIYVNAYEGGNIDHDVANFVASESYKNSSSTAEIYEFPLYNGYDGKLKVAEFIPRDDVETITNKINQDDIQLLEALFNIYESQQMIIKPMRLFLFNEKKIKKEGFKFRKLPKHNYLSKPHEGKLMYELCTRPPCKSFEEFKNSISRYFNQNNLN